MAANLAFASQCAVGVYARPRIRTNFTTKSYNIITTPNSMVSSFPVVFGDPIHSNWVVTKRGDQIKMMAADEEGGSELDASTATKTRSLSDYQNSMAASTTVNLTNKADKVIIRYSYKDFFGSEAGTSPILIEDYSDMKEFTHKGDDKRNSVGGFAYKIEGKVKWIVAWNNQENARNKVVTKIVDLDNIDWVDIKTQLQASDSTYVDNADAYGYRSSVEIDEKGSNPKLDATLYISRS